MRIINKINKSLSGQIVFLMGVCFLLFIIGMGTLFYLQNKTHHDYLQQHKSLSDKQMIMEEIYDQYNTEILMLNGSIALAVPESEKQALDQESNTKKLIGELQNMANTENEISVYRDMANFTDFYYSDVLPQIMLKSVNNKMRIVELSDRAILIRIENFLVEMKSSNELLQKQLDDHALDLSHRQLFIQTTVIIFFFLIMIIFLFIIRMIFRNVGKPLTDFSLAAHEIAEGRDAVINVDSSRNDELGALSDAFRKMIISIQDKEQNLMAQNEELLSQQDELQNQQKELQSTLEKLVENEQKLARRNELINGISISLDKKEVLQSIAESMCKVIQADRGMITFLYEETFASYGISDNGVQQFIRYLSNGFTQRLVSSKKAFSIKREQHPLEMGYHEEKNYSYDLYLPIITDLQEVDAIMVFSRYGDPFLEKEIAEYETLARQISISFEKIKLFEQSEENRRLNQDILNTVQEGIQLINKEGNIVHINQQFSKIFRNAKSSEEIVGMSWDKWIGSMAKEIQEQDFIKSLEKAIKEAAIFPDKEHSFVYRKKDSNQVIKVYCKTLFYKEEDFGTVIVHRDITKEYEVDQMKSEFVSTVSHELRTPLASILGFTELMLKKELKPEKKTKYLQTVYNEAQRLTALVNDFLDVQRMESGKQTYEQKYIDINLILKKVIEHQEINTLLHQIQISVESEQTYILGDRSKIEQVFTNLLSNAIKYSPNGGKISIRIYSNGDSVSIDIQDEGLGIPNEALPNLFQKFYRVDNSDRRSIGGTGLGLSIVSKIVKAHGGSISVDSTYGKGSVFTIQFPKVLLKEEISKMVDTFPRSGYNIMLVEDDLSLAELLKQELEDNGFNVNSINSGEKALEQLQKGAPDAIVLDIMFEKDEIDGWTIMEKIKESEEWRNIPIFVSTALEEKERGFSLGAKEYLVKPYKPNQLSKVIIHTLLTYGKQGQIMVPQK